MKVLHILDHSIPLHSGYTFRTRSILREQQKLGWKTVHITSAKHNRIRKGNEQEELVEGLKFYRTNEYLGFLKAMPVVNQWTVIKGLERRLESVVRIEKPDLIHAHSPALNGLAAINVARKFHLPVIYEVRAFWEDAAVDHGTTREGGWRYLLTRALETKVLKNVDAITTICNGLKIDIIKRGISKAKVTVIPNAVDADKFSIVKGKDASLVEKYDLRGKFVVGFVGSFYAYEGLDLIIDALLLLEKEHPDLKVMFVGGGPEEDALRSLVKDNKLDDKVIFTGRVPHETIHSYYSLIDVLLYPRVSMRLTNLVTPLKPLEAMAQKRLFIASDVGGHKELVKHEVNGFLFRSGDAQQLANQIVKIMQQPELADNILETGRKYIENERNWKKSVSYYVEVYNKLLERAQEK